MGPYKGSRLSATDAVRREKRDVLNVMKKKYGTKWLEKLYLELLINLPKEAKGDELVKAEMVAKLNKQLKAKNGPLGQYSSEKEAYDKAVEFLASQQGVAWMENWFLPDDRAVATETAKPTADQGVNNAESSNSDTVAAQQITPMTRAASTPVRSPTTAFNPTASGTGRAVQRSRLHRRYSDGEIKNGDISWCLRCKSVHSTAYGGPFLPFATLGSAADTVMGSAPQGAALQNLRVERRDAAWKTGFARDVLAFVKYIGWVCFLMLLARSVEGRQC